MGSPPPLGSWAFQRAMAALAAVFVAVAVCGWREVYVIPAHWVAHAIVIGGMVAAAAALRRVGAASATWRVALFRSADVFVAGSWAILCGAVTSPVTYAVMRAHVPLRDAELAAFDRAIGLPVPRVRGWLELLSPDTWWTVYHQLIPLLCVAVVVLPLVGRTSRARVLVFAYLLSFALTLPVMELVQAVGPWTVYGFPAAPPQVHYVTELTMLKAGGAFRFDPSDTTGVVTFPSFHTLLAALAGWALAPVRGLGPIAVVLASAIVLGTVATGWHYVADVIGGLLYAALSIAVAVRLDRRWWSGPDRA